MVSIVEPVIHTEECALSHVLSCAITCNYMQLHAITCNYTITITQLHAITMHVCVLKELK
jgi:hypothetical protein